MSKATLHTSIKPTNGAVNLRKEDYRTKDIIELTNEVLQTDKDDTEYFAKQFQPTKAGMRKLFYFVDFNFSYKEDPDGSQWVQTPSYLWKSKVGDCKSYTVFISSVLQNMGVDHIIRYAAYGTVHVRHVYPVAIINGRELPLDVVYWKEEGGAFGTEKPYTLKKDFPMKGLYKLGTVNSLSVAQQERNANKEVARIRSSVANIPDEIVDSGVGDVTKMTQGQWDRWMASIQYNAIADKTQNPLEAAEYRAASRALLSGNIAGIGAPTSEIKRQAALILNKSINKTQPAFQPFSVRFYEPSINGLFKKVGNFFKRIGSAISDAWKKLVNHVFKGIGRKMGPYFIYLFIKKNRVRSAEIKRRIADQEKTFNWMAEKGKLDRGKLAQVIAMSVSEQTEYTPEQIIATRTQRTDLIKSEIKGIGAVAVTALAVTAAKKINWAKVGEFIVKAINFIWEVIKKITSIFKRKDRDQAGEPSVGNSSDLEILKEEQNPTPDPNTGGGAGALLPLGLLAAGAYFIF